MKTIFFILILGLNVKSCGETKPIYVADHLVDCVGVGPQKCMLIKEKMADNWTNFYGNIEGFTYEKGFTYLLNVKIKTIKNPPADGSSLQYTLIEIISKEATKINLNNKWQVISLNGISKLNQPLTINFNEKEDQVSGFAGCNNFFGTYKSSGSAITFSQMGVTRKMCPDMSLENQVINTLRNIHHYNIIKHKLFLFNNENINIMVCTVIKK